MKMSFHKHKYYIRILFVITCMRKRKPRSILTTILASTLALLPACSSLPKQKPIIYSSNKTLADFVLETFPSSLEGAAEIRRYETPGAKQTLVHIKQVHAVIVKDEIAISPIVTKIQENIYSILMDLKKTQRLEVVLPEGFDEKDREWWYSKRPRALSYGIKPWGTEFRATDRAFFKGEIEIKESEDALVRRNCELADALYQARLEALKEEAQMETKLNLPPKPFLARIMQYKKDWIKGICDDREDCLLRIASENPDLTLVVTTYGASHSFAGTSSFPNYKEDKMTRSVKDNIYEWNREHSDKKFSLIEIFPKGLKN